MTLKEKLESFAMDNHIEKYAEHNAKQLEQIADEFAIGFADWIRVCKLKGRGYDFDDVKKLLEIYKDEKDL